MLALLSAATVEFSANTVNEFNEVKDNIEELSAATESFSAGTSSLFDTIIEAAGLNVAGRGSYPEHDDTCVIAGAKSLDEADVMLDAAVCTLIDDVEEIKNNVAELSGATEGIKEDVVEL